MSGEEHGRGTEGPVEETDDDAAGPAAAPQEDPPPADLADPRPTIVYVDADADNRRLVVELLEVTAAYRVHSTGDGVSGLELIREHQPVLVIVDLDLPVISAFELLRRVRASGAPISRTPLVALSASVMKGERQRCLRSGFMAFIEKPFDIKEFRARIAECVRRSPIGPKTEP